jgi:hypothetical protein
MPAPGQSDPRRPLRQSVRWMLILGLGLLVYAFFASTPALTYTLLNEPPPRHLPIALSQPAIYLVPGALLLALAIFVGRRQQWAIAVTLALAAIICAVLTVMVLLISFLLPGVDSTRTALWIIAILVTIDFLFSILILRLAHLLVSLRSTPGDVPIVPPPNPSGMSTTPGDTDAPPPGR